LARVSLQVKNIASLILATAASVCWGIAAKRFFDTPAKPWAVLAAAGLVCLGCQLGLIFVESKEEEELSLVRRQRMAAVQQSIEENEKLSTRIQKEMESGNIVEVRKRTAYRRSRDGK
jgi:hypothetical protein